MFSAIRDEGSAVLLLLLLVVGTAVLLLRNWLVDRINSSGLRRRERREATAPPLVATIHSAFEAGPEKADATGLVSWRGELWNARCSGDIASALKVGDRVEIGRFHGLTAEITAKVNDAV